MSMLDLGKLVDAVIITYKGYIHSRNIAEKAIIGLSLVNAQL
jgi:hypothetical protein